MTRWTIGAFWVLSLVGLTYGRALHDTRPFYQTTTVGCQDPIYCTGPILEMVQLSGVYNDSKTFVDQPMLKPEAEIMAQFEKLGKSPSKDAIKAFLRDNFAPAGTELKPTDLPEFREDVQFLRTIQDPILRGWGHALHTFWPELTRVVDNSTLCEGCRSTLLNTTYPFVVPGGRFREYYYWDTFFTMEGLIHSELLETTRLMILNFAEIVQERGFIPNGARTYYLNRSQPPMFTQMVRMYFEHTQDYHFLLEVLPIVRVEYDFWHRERSVAVPGKDGKQYLLNHYYVQETEPRPEAFKEDLAVGHLLSTDNNTQLHTEIYSELAAGAESGMDYTSRWAQVKNATQEEILASLETHNIVPVDLNSILYLNERDLATLNFQAYQYCATHTNETVLVSCEPYLVDALDMKWFAHRRRKAINAILWDKDSRTFKDFNLRTNSSTQEFALTNFWALWAMADQMEESDVLAHWKWLDKFQRQFPGGLPTTLLTTELQWDFPNAWPPLQYMVLRGLQKSYDILNTKYMASGNQTAMPPQVAELQQLEVVLAQKYVDSAFCAWYETGGSIDGLLARKAGLDDEDTGNMFEKFDVTTVGVTGTGGEYDPQVGFGWTNGVAIWLLSTYGDQLQRPSCLSPESA
ncbi:hypothetical protein H4R35_003241 [Dimargaris xerosporica]|nr:hypothetical protein H4R35_003241 [Dimargaris xerosporica]